MHDQLSDARSVRLLKVIDNFNREVLALGAIFLYRRIELGEHWNDSSNGKENRQLYGVITDRNIQEKY